MISRVMPYVVNHIDFSRGHEFIDLAMENMAEVNAYTVFLRSLNTG